MKKVVLGFSGGLDTTFCVKYLLEQQVEVHSILVNTGGFDETEVYRISEHAKSLGVHSHVTVDATQHYYQRIIRFLVFGNVLRNGNYPLSVSAERLVQAIEIAQHAKRLNVDAVAHGSTGAGNDQVRFDLIFQLMIPDITVITPVRDLALSREQEIDFLKERDVNMSFEKAAYSINKGLWGTSVGGKETLRSNGMLPEDAWPLQVSAQGSRDINLSFVNGELTSVDGLTFENPVNAIQQLQQLASPFGIGRDVHTGDTIIGIKGRVGFEAAAPLLIIRAHHALEKHVLSKWQLLQKDQLSQLYGAWLHEGLILDPVMRDIEAFLTSTQRKVTGEVFITLHPYRFVINGIESPHDLMNSRFGTYGEMNRQWTGDDVRGFTKIYGNASSVYMQTNPEEVTHGY
jgi:argininosuccinate synthase